MKAKAVAAKYPVSESCVRRLEQRRRETGEVAPRRQRHGPLPGCETRAYAAPRRAAYAETPDATLEEVKDRLRPAVALSTLWRACAASKPSFEKKAPEPPSKTAPTWPRSARSSGPPGL